MIAMKILGLAPAEGRREALVAQVTQAMRALQWTQSSLSIYEHANTGLLSLVPSLAQQVDAVTALYQSLQLGTQGLRSGPVILQTLQPCDALDPPVPQSAFCVFAQLVCAAENREGTLGLLRRMMENTRQESGNYRYDLYETQGGGAFWMFEAYHDEPAIAAHRQSAYYRSIDPLISAALSEPIRVHTRLRPNPPEALQ